MMNWCKIKTRLEKIGDCAAYRLRRIRRVGDGMIFVCIASCLLLIYWGGCAVDEKVIPWLFALTDGKFPPANAFGAPFTPFTALVTYSERFYMILQIVVLLSVLYFAFVLADRKRVKNNAAL